MSKDSTTTKTEVTKRRLVLSSVEIPKTTRHLHFLEKFTHRPSFAIEIPFLPRPNREMDVSTLPYEFLDLTVHGIEMSDICRNTMKLLMNAKRIIVVAGAGISVAAGIPDFRSPAGLFSTLKADTKFKPSGKALFDASVYKVFPCSRAS